LLRAAPELFDELRLLRPLLLEADEFRHVFDPMDDVRHANAPPSDSGRRMSCFWTGMVSGTRFANTRSSEALRFRTPVACGSSGLSGKTSKRPRPRTSSRFVIVARRYASLAATIFRSALSTR